MSELDFNCPHCSKKYNANDLLELTTHPNGDIKKNEGDSYILNAVCLECGKELRKFFGPDMYPLVLKIIGDSKEADSAGETGADSTVTSVNNATQSEPQTQPPPSVWVPPPPPSQSPPANAQDLFLTNTDDQEDDPSLWLDQEDVFEEDAFEDEYIADDFDDSS